MYLTLLSSLCTLASFCYFYTLPMDYGIPQRRHLNVPNVKAFASQGLGLVRKNKKVLVVVLAAAFLFYWYEIRPMRINSFCAAQSSASSRSLLRSKAAVTTDVANKAYYAGLAEKNMYLRSDYESYYKKCLRGYGVYL